LSRELPSNPAKPESKPLVAVPSRSNPRLAASSPAAQGTASRLLRTVVLGTLALGAGVWYLADMFSVDRAELLGYLGASAMLMLGLMLLAAVTVGVLRLLRR
jgi:hypothetical protein